MPTASVMTILGYLSIIETVEKGSLLLWNDENDFPEVKHQPNGFLETFRYLWKRMETPTFGFKLQFMIHDILEYVTIEEERETMLTAIPPLIEALKRLSSTYSGRDSSTQQLLHTGISDLGAAVRT